MTEEKTEGEPKPRKSLEQMQIEAMRNEGKSAWACPTCGCQNFKVTNTWFLGDNRKRLRKCRNCGEPITTCEIPVPDGYSLEVKKNT